MMVVVLAAVFAFSFCLVSISAVHAQTGGGPPNSSSGTGGGPPTGPTSVGISFNNPLKFQSIPQFVRGLLDVLVIIAFPIIILFIVYAGFLFVSARGNPDKINEAKRLLLWTIVGALIILGASVIARAIEGTVNSLR